MFCFEIRKIVFQHYFFKSKIAVKTPGNFKILSSNKWTDRYCFMIHVVLNINFKIRRNPINLFGLNDFDDLLFNGHHIYSRRHSGQIEFISTG
jgi:hypothetical protein